jgi:hypothetical protein
MSTSAETIRGHTIEAVRLPRLHSGELRMIAQGKVLRIDQKGAADRPGNYCRYYALMIIIVNI